MGKKSRVKSRVDAPADDAVGRRQQCPCGSGRRYKHCHGRAGGPPTPYVARTFEGLPGECDWVALREIVPAATAPLRLRDGVGDDRDVQVCTLLPLGMPALVRADGSVWLGLQVHANHGDVSRDLAYTLELALAARPGSQVSLDGPPPAGPRLQEVVDPDADFVVTVHDGFDYWLADTQDTADTDAQAAAALKTANEAAAPTKRLASVDAAYWTRMGDREYVRWVLPHSEARLLDALARLHAAGADRLGDSGRLLGMFRAHGLLTPVWELAIGTGADGFDEHMSGLASRLDAALDDESVLSSEQRSARSGLANRQVTIR
ncbi:MAG: SEC-C domain-containing protein [Actinomycetota bacterium]|nr:SEC-C domain-containing protein [Nocardioidaceae bacterium]MDQ3592451.1 SEC-C domain-containing protein [Actinomycetota bacterium]